jgi:hypothetical protein
LFFPCRSWTTGSEAGFDRWSSLSRLHQWERLFWDRTSAWYQPCYSNASPFSARRGGHLPDFTRSHSRPALFTCQLNRVDCGLLTSTKLETVGTAKALPNVPRYPSTLQQEIENRLSPLREVIRDFCGKAFQFWVWLKYRAIQDKLIVTNSYSATKTRHQSCNYPFPLEI